MWLMPLGAFRRALFHPSTDRTKSHRPISGTPEDMQMQFSSSSGIHRSPWILLSAWCGCQNLEVAVSGDKPNGTNICG